MKKDPVYRLLQIITFALFVVMSLLVFLQVILRYFFSTPIAWSDEISRLLFIWVSFLGVALAFTNKAHPSITFLIEKVPEKAREKFDIAINAFLLVVFLIITFYGIQLCMETHRIASTILRYPMSVQYASLPVCAIFMCYDIVRGFIQKLNSRKAK